MKKTFLNILIVMPFIFSHGQVLDYKDLDSADYKGVGNNKGAFNIHK